MATTATAIMIEEMKKTLRIFAINMGNRFNELSMKVTKLDLRLSNIERQCCPELRAAIAKDLEQETMHVMEDAGCAFLKRKQEASTTITPPPRHGHCGEQAVHHGSAIHRTNAE